jgi:uncharacterized protein (DUF2345 family)
VARRARRSKTAGRAEAGPGQALVPLHSVELARGQRLEVERGPGEDVVRLIAGDGKVTLSIHLTPEGPVLSCEAAALAVRTSGRLSLEAEHIRLHGRAGLELSSGGDVVVSTPGDLHSHARIQNITADLGNVNVKANDDVKLNGERVMVNC